ncbi:glucoamylase family protein [Pseudoduganella sp. RAF19]|uniref:GH39 family glycosyl hydrolase n=2 Tax=unclassified Pseudoduganella TaxID=2637179 RepID=UPI003F9E935B
MTVQFRCDLSAQPVPLVHSWEACIGSGRATLALRADWQDQLQRVREELGMRQVRFHSMLDDDMGTLFCYQDQPRYDFYNIESFFDFLLDIGMRPFVELSFMPRMLASGDTTVFAGKGNVTAPRDMRAWQTLLQNLVRHLINRYGAEEVRRWQFEVWNEPNQPQFWPAGQEAYFQLFDASYEALKQVDPQLIVGGPATSKNAWIPEFIEHCRKSCHLPDFISTHHYPADAVGNAYSDANSQLVNTSRSVLRDQATIARGQAGRLPLHYTEWKVSSDARDPLNDEPFSAALIVKSVLEVANLADTCSYCTFSDISAENHFPNRPFHGGFGLLNRYGIPKPSYRAFQLLHRAGTELLPVGGHHETVDVWVTRAPDCLCIFVTNCAMPQHPITTETVHLTLGAAPDIQTAMVTRIDALHGYARPAWEAMGRPDCLSREQCNALEDGSALKRETLPLRLENGATLIELSMPPQSVALIELPWTKGASRDEDSMLEEIERETWDYFLHEYCSDNGLVADSTRPGSPCSVAVTGMALSCYPVAVERGYCTRAEAVKRTLTVLRFFRDSEQSDSPEATGHHGFYYHFLDMRSGRRTWDCELSTIDTALLVAGMLTAAQYFDGDDPAEAEIRLLADMLYHRIDCPWALNGCPALSHGWMPDRTGFLPYRWQGYSEALLLYILGLGSPTHPLPSESYIAWCESYLWKEIYGREVLYGGPLFMHQLSHCWLDLRGIRDHAMRTHNSDYFENSRRATQIQQEYALRNPLRMKTYSALCWGISAGEGPGMKEQKVNGIDRQFYGYVARGAPFGPDDGTMLPAAVAASLPFAPELVLPSLAHFIDSIDLKSSDRYGFKTSFNAEFCVPGASQTNPWGWVSEWHYGLNQGPIVLMLENYRTGLIWRLMRRCPYVVEGLRRAGFTGGWLEQT